MATLLMLAPESGAKLRRCGEGFDDAGSAYVFRIVTMPIEHPQGKWVTWQRVELRVRSNAAIDFLVTPIVDEVILSTQAMTLTLGTPTGWQRRIVAGRFEEFGQKIKFLIETTTLPGQFRIDGMWVEGVPQAGYQADA